MFWEMILSHIISQLMSSRVEEKKRKRNRRRNRNRKIRKQQQQQEKTLLEKQDYSTNYRLKLTVSHSVSNSPSHTHHLTFTVSHSLSHTHRLSLLSHNHCFTLTVLHSLAWRTSSLKGLIESVRTRNAFLHGLDRGHEPRGTRDARRPTGKQRERSWVDGGKDFT